MNKTLIIVGMHRSGTSLTAQWLHACGLYLGKNLLGANTGNDKGHFEDLDFLEFHKEILLRNNLPASGLTNKNLSSLDISDVQLNRIRNILNLKSKEHTEWGWKEPRTSLFLNTYETLLNEQAYYLVVYRNVEEVVSSLLRRHIKVEFQKRKKSTLKSKLYYFLFKKKLTKSIIENYSSLYIETWIQYNEQIIDHIKNVSDQKIFVTNYYDLLHNSNLCFEWLSSKNFHLKHIRFNEIYDKKLMQNETIAFDIPTAFNDKINSINNFFNAYYNN